MWANAHRVWHPGHGNVRAWLGLDGGQGESAHATVLLKKKGKKGGVARVLRLHAGASTSCWRARQAPVATALCQRSGAAQRWGCARSPAPPPTDTGGSRASAGPPPLLPRFSSLAPTGQPRRGGGCNSYGRRAGSSSVREKEERARALERAVPSATERRGVLLLWCPAHNILYHAHAAPRHAAPCLP